MDLNYGSIGLKCGIEIHQQLESGHKLFCNCPPRLAAGSPVISLMRTLRAVSGEMGSVDRAALHESKRGMRFDYKVYRDENCLVETDSEPPHAINAEALETTLQIGLMLGCEIPEEAHVMRKTVIDGSNTSGFQRTVLVGLNGKLPTGSGDIGITGICLEEDAAQILERSQDAVAYGLDRLGIPLVEIGTAADVRSPVQAREVALMLGMILRSTGKVKRGIGTIRQDINVSVKGGARVEIKGAQELNTVPKLVEYEARRQLALISIRDELLERGFPHLKPRIMDVSGIFRDSASKIMQNKPVYATLIKGFAGFLKRNLTPTRTLGNEIANYVRVLAKVPGIVHSDENLEKYQLTKEFKAIGDLMKAKDGDTVIIVAADRKLAERTFGAVAERVNGLLAGVPKEVRKALPSGDTEFLRPLPGSARMYPETDIPPIIITKGMISRLKANLPETWEEKIKRLAKQYKITEEASGQIVHSGKDELFAALSKKHDPSMVYSTLIPTMRELEREGLETAAVTEEQVDSVLSMVSGRKIGREAIPAVLKEIIRNPELTAEEAAKIAGCEGMTTGELVKMIRRIIEKNKNLLANPKRESMFMGLVMKEARGRIDGKTVMDCLRKELEKK